MELAISFTADEMDENKSWARTGALLSRAVGKKDRPHLLHHLCCCFQTAAAAAYRTRLPGRTEEKERGIAKG